MERIKIGYIGAGSFRFSTAFFNDLILLSANNSLPLEVGLCDINAKSLNLIKKYFIKIIEANKKFKCDIKITSSVNHRDILENADIVYKSISVGTQESEWYDIYLPLKLGIPQNTGDTVGPGGLFRGLRVIPIVMGIVRDMKELCPKAPILNYTNPQSTIVMAANTISKDIQFVGLCHELYFGINPVLKYFNKFHSIKIKNLHEIDIKYAGVNHFAWLTEIGLSQNDLYDKLRSNPHKFVLKNLNAPVNDYRGGFNFHLLEKYNYYPYPGSRHIAEFLPDYYNYFNYKIQTSYWKFPQVRNVSSIGNARRIFYEKIKETNNPKNFYIRGPSLERVIDMTLSFFDNDKSLHAVNIPNEINGNKIIDKLPSDCIVEIPAYFNNKVITPLDGIKLPNHIAELLLPHCKQQRLTVDAALGNDIDLIYKAMLHDPMCRWIEDEERIKYLTDLMVFYEQQWLPEIWKEWIPSRNDLKKSKWWVSNTDLSVEDKKYQEIKYPIKAELKSKAFFWNDSDIFN
ncbi:MAG: hypothetical protein ACFFA3_02170 [Promethearchaeota archaeon]